MVCLQAGCFSVKRELNKEQERGESDWASRHQRYKPGVEIQISWEDALVKMRRGNDKVRAADLDCLRAMENGKQVRRSWIPMLSAQAGYTQPLTNGTNIDPFNFATSLLFDVPSMVGYNLRYQTAELMRLRSTLAREAVWREQVVDLYRTFAKGAQLSRERNAIEEAIRQTNAPGAANFQAALERRRIAVAKSQAEVSERVGELLGAPGTVFRCAPEALPKLPHESPSKRPLATDLARLPLRLAALELVALRARELGANLQNWPELNIFVSTPTLFRRASGQDTFWSSRDAFVGGNVFWTLDTRGQRASQKRILKAEATLRREALEREATKLSNRIESALASLAETDGQLEALRKAAPLGTETALDHALGIRRNALLEERREWLLILWFFDDSLWSGIPAAPSLVPKPSR